MGTYSFRQWVHDHQGREHGSTQQAGRDVSAAVADSSHLETQPRGTESWQKWPESFETSKSIYTQWHTSSNKVASTNPSQTIPPSIQTYKPMETILIQITIATKVYVMVGTEPRALCMLSSLPSELHPYLLRSEKFMHIFSSKSFIILVLIFTPRVQLELVFVYRIR